MFSHDPNRLPDVYDPRFIHADVELAAVAAGLVAARSGRLCLYGPPGTGQTAYGRWLASSVWRSSVRQTVPDPEIPRLGESEKNISKAFREAAMALALLIDEVDSFSAGQARCVTQLGSE